MPNTISPAPRNPVTQPLKHELTALGHGVAEQGDLALRVMANTVTRCMAGDRLKLAGNLPNLTDTSQTQFLEILQDISQLVVGDFELETNAVFQPGSDIYNRLFGDNEAAIFVLNHENQSLDPLMLAYFNRLYYAIKSTEKLLAEAPRPAIMMNQQILNAAPPELRRFFEFIGEVGVKVNPFPTPEDRAYNRTLRELVLDQFCQNTRNLFVFPEGIKCLDTKHQFQLRFSTGFGKYVLGALEKGKPRVKVVPLGLCYSQTNKKLAALHIGDPIYFRLDQGKLCCSQGSLKAQNPASQSSEWLFHPTHNALQATPFAVPVHLDDQDYGIVHTRGTPLKSDRFVPVIAQILAENLDICRQQAVQIMGLRNSKDTMAAVNAAITKHSVPTLSAISDILAKWRKAATFLPAVNQIAFALLPDAYRQGVLDQCLSHFKETVCTDARFKPVTQSTLDTLITRCQTDLKNTGLSEAARTQLFALAHHLEAARRLDELSPQRNYLMAQAVQQADSLPESLIQTGRIITETLSPFSRSEPMIQIARQLMLLRFNNPASPQYYNQLDQCQALLKRQSDFYQINLNAVSTQLAALSGPPELSTVIQTLATTMTEADLHHVSKTLDSLMKQPQGKAIKHQIQQAQKQIQANITSATVREVWQAGSRLVSSPLLSPEFMATLLELRQAVIAKTIKNRPESLQDDCKQLHIYLLAIRNRLTPGITASTTALQTAIQRYISGEMLSFSLCSNAFNQWARDCTLSPKDCDMLKKQIMNAGIQLPARFLEHILKEDLQIQSPDPRIPAQLTKIGDALKDPNTPMQTRAALFQQFKQLRDHPERTCFSYAQTQVLNRLSSDLKAAIINQNQVPSLMEL